MSDSKESSGKKKELTKSECIEILENRIRAIEEYGASASAEKLDSLARAIQTLANLKGWNSGRDGEMWERKEQ